MASPLNTFKPGIASANTSMLTSILTLKAPLRSDSYWSYLDKIPFKLLSIQVDGGSEFMADFETACAELNIPLLVLPPRKPQYNGGVERGNRTFQEEFYANPNMLADSIGHMRHELSKALNIYNTFRPHFNLKGLTPMQYIISSHQEAA
jgi:putative transposase